MRMTFAILELIDPYRAIRKPGDHVQLASQRPHDPSKRRNLHVGLALQLGEARLLDAQRFGNFALTLAGEFSHFAQQQFTE